MSHPAYSKLSQPIAQQELLQGHTLDLITKIKKSIENLLVFASNEWKKKYEPLLKGSFQRRHPFKPQRDVSVPQREAAERWRGGEEPGIDTREDIERLEGPGRERALKKIASLTEVRSHNGKRHFLMHRGVGGKEYDNVVGEHGNAKANYKSSGVNMSSWSPLYEKGTSFAKDYTTEEGSHLYGESKYGQPKGIPISAWISEDDVHHYLPQIGTEYEVPGIRLFNGTYVILSQFLEKRETHQKYDKFPSVPEGFIYRSDKNDKWLTIEELQKMIERYEL